MNIWIGYTECQDVIYVLSKLVLNKVMIGFSTKAQVDEWVQIQHFAGTLGAAGELEQGVEHHSLQGNCIVIGAKAVILCYGSSAEILPENLNPNSTWAGEKVKWEAYNLYSLEKSARTNSKMLYAKKEKCSRSHTSKSIHNAIFSNLIYRSETVSKRIYLKPDGSRLNTVCLDKAQQNDTDHNFWNFFWCLLVARR